MFLLALAKPDRTQVPVVHLGAEKAAPVPKEFFLKNGIPVWFWVDKRLPLISISIQLQGGLEHVTQPAALVLDAKNWLQGPRWHYKGWLSRKMTQLGAEMQLYLGRKHSQINIEVLKGHEEEGLVLLQNSLKKPNRWWWKEKRLQLMKEGRWEEQNLATVHAKAIEKAALHLLNEANPRVIRALSLRDIRKAHQEFLSYGALGIVVVGDIEVPALKAILNKQFSLQKARHISQKAMVFPPSKHIIVDFPTFDRVGISILLPRPSRSHPDLQALHMANAIIGGGFTSRLSQNLREKHGYSYTIASQLRPYFIDISTTVSIDDLPQAIKELQKELKGMTLQPPTTVELKRALMGHRMAHIKRLSTGSSIAKKLAFEQLHTLKASSWQKSEQDRQSLSLAAVQTAASRYFSPQKAIWIITGNAQKIEQLLAQKDGEWQKWSMAELFLKKQ